MDLRKTRHRCKGNNILLVLGNGNVGRADAEEKYDLEVVYPPWQKCLTAIYRAAPETKLRSVEDMVSRRVAEDVGKLVPMITPQAEILTRYFAMLEVKTLITQEEPAKRLVEAGVVFTLFQNVKDLRKDPETRLWSCMCLGVLFSHMKDITVQSDYPPWKEKLFYTVQPRHIRMLCYYGKVFDDDERKYMVFSADCVRVEVVRTLGCLGDMLTREIRGVMINEGLFQFCLDTVQEGFPDSTINWKVNDIVRSLLPILRHIFAGDESITLSQAETLLQLMFHLGCLMDNPPVKVVRKIHDLTVSEIDAKSADECCRIIVALYNVYGPRQRLLVGGEAPDEGGGEEEEADDSGPPGLAKRASNPRLRGKAGPGKKKSGKNKPAVPPGPKPSCTRCGDDLSELRKCGACGRAALCSKQCAYEQWIMHREACLAHVKTEVRSGLSRLPVKKYYARNRLSGVHPELPRDDQRVGVGLFD